MTPLKQALAVAAIAAVAGGVYIGAVPGFGGSGSGGAGVGSDASALPQRGGRVAEASPIVSMAVGLGETERSVRAIGTGAAVRSVTLIARAGGLVEEIAVSPGQVVQAGATILRLDADSERLAVDTALGRKQAADTTLARVERLASNGTATTTQAEDARNAARSAAAELDNAELALDRRTIVAPFEGIVGIPRVSEGDLVNTSTELVTLDDRSIIRVDFEIPERHLGDISVGMPVRARTPSDGGQAARGAVTAIDSRVDPVSRTVLVRADLINDDDRLRPGMSFDVRVDLPGQQAISIPPLAMQLDRDGAWFWVVRDGAAQKLYADILQRRDDAVLVNTDITVGDHVIVQGFQGLRAGSPVRSVSPPEVADAR